jgi:hypothetical protein
MSGHGDPVDVDAVQRSKAMILGEIWVKAMLYGTSQCIQFAIPSSFVALGAEGIVEMQHRRPFQPMKGTGANTGS